MKLYFELVRIFTGAGLKFGIAMAVVMVLATNWTVGLTYGFMSGLLITYGVPLVLFAFGKNRRSSTRFEN